MHPGYAISKTADTLYARKSIISSYEDTVYMKN